MNTNRSKLLGGVLALIVAFGGVGFAGATLTMDATSVVGNGAVTINAAPASDVVIGSLATTGAITIGAATATAVSIVDDNWSITTAGVGTLSSLVVSGVNGITAIDDAVVSLGTTTTNAATKVTLEFDKTTTGVGQFIMGTSDNPQVLPVNPGATVKGESIALKHSAGAGNLNDLIASYKRVEVVGAGDADLTIVGDAPRTYVGVTGGANNSVASAAYASQPWVKHAGTGAITAMSGVSALLDVTDDNFTASTVNAGHFHIQGGATVTGQYDGVMIEAYPTVRSMDSMLAIAVDTGAVVDAGIRITGSPVSQMNLSSGAKIFTGTAANEDAVYAEVGAVDATGSIYISTAGGMYIQVANNGADADWEKMASAHH